MEAGKKNTWDNLHRAFEEEFILSRDDDEIVIEIYNTRQEKKESVKAYTIRLKELIGKLDNKSADGLKKRWFIEGLTPSLRKKMKIVPQSTFADACTRAMDIESKNKTSKARRHGSSRESSEESEEESKTIQVLRKDLR